jgi:hypothetical protein
MEKPGLEETVQVVAFLPMSALCLFCRAGGPGVLTKEHVNPQWLLQYLELPKDDQLFQAVATSATGALVGEPRIHSSFNFVEGRVCDGCNSGWMNRLEIAAKPLLTTLIDGSRPLRSLSASETAVLSKWAAKTAYLHTWAGPLKHPVQLAHLEALEGDSGQPTLGVGVFGMQSEYKQPSAYIQSGEWHQLGGAETWKSYDIPAEAYKIGLQYRGLYLLVAFWPSLEALFARVRDMHVRLLPADNAPDPECAIELAIGDGLIERLAAFTNLLAVWHGSGRAGA